MAPPLFLGFVYVKFLVNRKWSSQFDRTSIETDKICVPIRQILVPIHGEECKMLVSLSEVFVVRLLSVRVQWTSKNPGCYKPDFP